VKVRHLRWRFYRKAGGPRGIGNRCGDYGPGCIVCESYRFLSRYGRFPSFDEVGPICDVVNGNPPRRDLPPDMWETAKAIAADLERADRAIERITAKYGL
jgi:hypothetical protein